MYYIWSWSSHCANSHIYGSFLDIFLIFAMFLCLPYLMPFFQIICELLGLSDFIGRTTYLISFLWIIVFSWRCLLGTMNLHGSLLWNILFHLEVLTNVCYSHGCAPDLILNSRLNFNWLKSPLSFICHCLTW